MRKTRLHWLSLLLVFVLASLGTLGVIAQDNPDGFPEPELVVVPGSFQDELGCSGEWQPDCEETALSFNEDSGLWEGVFNIPAGEYEYKVALDGGWDRNYGAGAEAGGPNIALSLTEDTEVAFTYDHATGIITDSINGEAAVEQVAEEEAAPAEATVPELVNIPGTIQPELGCPGEWAPDCEATLLTYVEQYNIWEGTFDLPAGDYEYKVAINGTWDENYGGFADPGGPNIVLNNPEDQSVTWVYSHETNWIMDTVRQQIVTAPGSYQDEIGCENEWMPECMLSWLQDVDGDGIYTFSTDAIPAGEYEAKAAIGRSWDENYGAGGEADGANIAFTVPADGETVTFTYDSNITTMVITVGGTNLTGANLRERTAHWVLADTFAWNVEAEEGRDYRLLYSPDASMTLDVFSLSGDYEAFDLSVNEEGLPQDVREKFPHLAEFTAFTLSEDALAQVPQILTGQFAIAAFEGENMVDLAGLQIPGVLD
ncbi:MAG: hypothetical protein KC496_13370, partial [Anaerolineae bacterium]|nr:hypothetical protein [Anaerolineae bacterium]